MVFVSWSNITLRLICSADRYGRHLTYTSYLLLCWPSWLLLRKFFRFVVYLDILCEYMTPHGMPDYPTYTPLYLDAKTRLAHLYILLSKSRTVDLNNRCENRPSLIFWKLISYTVAIHGVRAIVGLSDIWQKGNAVIDMMMISSEHGR
jgi:hypothetical protein